MNPKKTTVLVALLIAAVCSASPVRAGIVVNVTKGSPSDTFLNMTISGSSTILSTNSADQWNLNAMSSDIFRNLTRATGNDIFNTQRWSDNTAGPGITASSGSTTLNMNSVFFFSRPSQPRNDFSFGFDANPSPLWQPGDVVTFSGSATINLSGGQTAALFNTGTWSGNATVGELIWASQFGDSPGLPVTLNISEAAPAAVPEPGTWAAAALLTGGAAFMRWRRRAKVA